jgi:alcohol dehydrogenase YqhD (iron-dependent ADH family)
VSARAKVDEDIWDLEFKKHEYPTEFIPMGVIVTVSGTGSEENNGAVITSEETKQKNGMGGAFADFAILDPLYTKTVPQKQLISGAFDTLSHAMETYFDTPRESFIFNDIAEAIMRKEICAMDSGKGTYDPDDLSNKTRLCHIKIHE